MGTKNTSEERQAWLENGRTYLTGLLTDKTGQNMPENARVTIGFPVGSRKAIGQAVFAESVSDGMHELFVSPALQDSVVILATLLHEMIHAIHPKAKHGGMFKTTALAAGLTGKMTATVASEKLSEQFKSEFISVFGDYPAGSISLGSRTKAPTRLLKAECDECGYVVRVTAKWVNQAGPPHCPHHGAMTVEATTVDVPLAPDADKKAVAEKKIVGIAPRIRKEKATIDFQWVVERAKTALEIAKYIAPWAKNLPKPKAAKKVKADPVARLVDEEDKATLEEIIAITDEPPEPVTVFDECATEYVVDQDDPEFKRSEAYPIADKSKAEAKARQWSKTGKEKIVSIRAMRDGVVVGQKDFHGGLAAPPVGEYPLV